MIIDVNAQIGEPWGTLVSQTADELLARMDAAGVERAIVGPFPFGNFDNEYVARAVAAHSNRLSGVVMMSPFSDETVAESLTKYVDDAGFVGVRLHPAAHGYKLSERLVVADILEGALERDVPIVAYSGDELFATPFQLMIAAEQYPELTFVMLHSGFMNQTNDAVMVAERCSNVYLEHSSGISAGLVQSIDAVGAERVLYGSDSPYMDMAVELYKIDISVAEESARKLILGENARQLFRL